MDIDELERRVKNVEASFVRERRGISHGSDLCGERIAEELFGIWRVPRIFGKQTHCDSVLRVVEERPEARIAESVGRYSGTRRVLPMNERMLYIAVLAIFKLLGQQKTIREVKDAVNEATKDYDKHNPPY
jgi:hypothetical protein